MKTNELKKLLAKYYNGETSLADENELQKYFSGDSVPKEFEAERKMFLFFAKESQTPLGDEHFEERIIEKITKGASAKKSNIFKYTAWAVSGIAASLILFFNLNVNEPDTQLIDKAILSAGNSMEDSDEAYEETKKSARAGLREPEQRT